MGSNNYDIFPKNVFQYALTKFKSIFVEQKNEIELTMAEYNALSTAEKMDPTKKYWVTDAEGTSVVLDDNVTTTNSVWSSSKTNNMLNGKLSDNPTFTEASTRANIESGESLATILGKIKKFFTDLKTVAFTGSYSDLTNTPNLPIWTSTVSKLVGATSATISNSNITTTSRVEIFGQTSSGKPFVYKTMTASNGSVSLTFDALTENTDICARVTNI